MSIPPTQRDRSRSFDSFTAAQPGMRVARVMANHRCACFEPVVMTFGDGSERGPILDRLPALDGAYVVVQNVRGSQMAIAYDEKKHDGWKRYAAHVCKEDGNG